MRLSKLIDRLIRLQESGKDPIVTIMQETYLPAMLPNVQEKQIESEVRDIAKSSNTVIIIGREID